MDETEPKRTMPRRKFIGGMAAAAMAAQMPETLWAQSVPTPENSLAEALAKHPFTGQYFASGANTAPVDLGDATGRVTAKDLSKLLKGKYSTISFGYNGCSTFCTFIHPNLAKIGEFAKRNNKEVVSIVIDVTPGMEQLIPGKFIRNLRTKPNPTQDAAANMGLYGIQQDLILLHPARQRGSKFVPSQEEADSKNFPQVAVDVGIIGSAPGNAINHTGMIGFYRPDGQQINMSDGGHAFFTNDDIKELTHNFRTGPGQSR